MGWLCREPVHLPPITIVPSFIDLTSFDLNLSGVGAATIYLVARYIVRPVRRIF